jgi:hypothetical protein
MSGQQVKCLHVRGGVCIREDDYDDGFVSFVEDMGPDRSKKRKRAPGASERTMELLIRAHWPGQTWLLVSEFRGPSNRRQPPFHEGRITSLTRMCNLIWKAIYKVTKNILH